LLHNLQSHSIRARLLYEVKTLIPGCNRWGALGAGRGKKRGCNANDKNSGGKNFRMHRANSVKEFTIKSARIMGRPDARLGRRSNEENVRMGYANHIFIFGGRTGWRPSEGTRLWLSLA
jgi:hypothetical protein